MLSPIDALWSIAMISSRRTRRAEARVADEPFGHHRAEIGLVVLEVGEHRAVPVDVAVPGPSGAGRPRRARRCTACIVGRPSRSSICATTLATTWRAVAESVSGSRCCSSSRVLDQVHVGLERLEHLGFEQQVAGGAAVRSRRAASPAPRRSGSSGGCRRASGRRWGPTQPSPPARLPRRPCRCPGAARRTARRARRPSSGRRPGAARRCRRAAASPAPSTSRQRRSRSPSCTRARRAWPRSMLDHVTPRSACRSTVMSAVRAVGATRGEAGGDAFGVELVFGPVGAGASPACAPVADRPTLGRLERTERAAQQRQRSG